MKEVQVDFPLQLNALHYVYLKEDLALQKETRKIISVISRDSFSSFNSLTHFESSTLFEYFMSYSHGSCFVCTV